MPASIVVGQSNMTDTSASVAQNKTSSISDVFVDSSGRLIYVSAAENRVLIWNSIPTTNGAPADLVLGQANFTSSSANRGGSADANTLSGPTGAYSDGQRLFIADNANRRVLIWNTFPTQNGQAANVVVGQGTMNSTSSVCGQSGFSSPWGVAVYNGRMVISNQSQDRVLIWNSIPTTNGAPADVVIGQTSFSLCTAASATQSTIVTPRGVAVDSTGRLFVTDSGANRVMVWNSIPTTNTVSADLVIGQTSFSGSSASYSASTLGSSFTRRVYSSGSRLYIPDGPRVLIWNSIPTSNGASADIVLGQSDFTSSSANQGGSVSSSSMNATTHLFEFNNQLFVGDSSNNRILIFQNTFSTPKITISSPSTLSDSRIKIIGNIKQGERTHYSLQNLKAQINGEGFLDVTYRDGGRDDGPDSTMYEFYHEFSPWSGNGNKDTWSPNGYTIKFKVSNSNTDENNLFYFYPFTLTSASSNTYQVDGPKSHWQKLKDNLNSLSVKYLKSGSNQWVTLESGIRLSDSMFESTTGKITFKTVEPVPTEATSIKVIAIDNWGNQQESNIFTLPTISSSNVSPQTSTQNIPVLKPTPSPSPFPSKTPDLNERPISTNEVQKNSNFFTTIINSIKQFFSNLLKFKN